MVAVAAARPFWVYGGSSFKRGDVDVVVAIDASASMWVKDLGPSRLDLAVREALGLYTQDILTPGDRTALRATRSSRPVFASPSSQPHEPAATIRSRSEGDDHSMAATPSRGSSG